MSNDVLALILTGLVLFALHQLEPLFSRGYRLIVEWAASWPLVQRFSRWRSARQQKAREEQSWGTRQAFDAWDRFHNKEQKGDI